MIGFPSETEKDFEATLNLVKKVGFKYVVIFPYHDKENTLASKMQDKVSQDIVKERIKKAKKYLRGNGIKVYMSCPD